MGPARLYRLFPSPHWGETDLNASTDPFRPEGRFLTVAKKKAIRNHFDACAPHRSSWEQKARAYYEDQIRYFRCLVPEGLRVLEIGSGIGNLLGALKPSRGLGIDLSLAMVKETARRHPTLEFWVGDKGFAHAMGGILMILDADATMPPEALPKFYEAIASGKGELIIGCRLIYPQEGRTMRPLMLFGNKVFGMAFSWLLNQRLKDTLCGTKVLFRRDYEGVAVNRSYFGEFGTIGDFELLFGASKLNLQMVEIPIRCEAGRSALPRSDGLHREGCCSRWWSTESFVSRLCEQYLRSCGAHPKAQYDTIAISLTIRHRESTQHGCKPAEAPPIMSPLS